MSEEKWRSQRKRLVREGKSALDEAREYFWINANDGPDSTAEARFEEAIETVKGVLEDLEEGDGGGLKV